MAAVTDAELAPDLQALDAAELRPLVSELRREAADLRGWLAQGAAEAAALRARLEPGAKAILMRNPLVGADCPELDVRFAGNGEPSAMLYVSNLPGPQVDLESLLAVFASFGLAVDESKVLPSPSGRGPSSALVRLSSAEEATSAIQALRGQAPGQLGLQASQQLESQETLTRRARAGVDSVAPTLPDGVAAAASSSSSTLGQLGHNSIEQGMLSVRGGQADTAAQATLSSAGQEALRSWRRPPAEPAKLKRERPMHLVVNIMPGAMVMNGNRPETINLLVHGPVFVADIKRQLAEAGLSWGPLMPRDGGPLDPPEGQALEGARLLFRGMPLKTDLSLQAQGAGDGSELRLLRARTTFQRGAHELRLRGGSDPGAPRGLLMNPGMPAWQPGMTRRGPEDFFETVHREDPGHLSHLPSLAVMKKGRPDIESVFTVR